LQTDWFSDAVLMSSRDGRRFDRAFKEAFVRPGPDPDNWHERSIYIMRGILDTGPAEMSLYTIRTISTGQCAGIRMRSWAPWLADRCDCALSCETPISTPCALREREYGKRRSN
jgi:hypothetical protein